MESICFFVSPLEMNVAAQPINSQATRSKFAAVYGAHVALRVSELTECRITADELTGRRVWLFMCPS